MDCQFQLTADGVLRCRRCGRTLFGRRSSLQPVPHFRSAPRKGVVRVGAYYPNVYVGGAEVWLRTLFKNLPAPCEVVGVAVDGFGALPTLPFDGITVSTDRDSLLDCCDVLIVWGISMASVRRRYAGPTVYVGHSQLDQVSPHNHQLACETDYCVAVSETARFGLPPHRRDNAVVIPNGCEVLDLPERGAARTRLGVGDVLTVGYVGRWSDEKEPLACARAVAELPEAVAVYHGYRQQDEQDFRAYVERLTSGRVIFRGPDMPVAETWSALDCFVHVPYGEAFGLVYCEAWQAGVPVVASNVGVVAESGCPHDVATVVPYAADGPALAAAVRRAVDGATVQTARELTLAKYSAEAMGRRWSDYLAGITEQHAVVSSGRSAL